MTNFIQVVLLGIIEGITEFLPISSTGHLLLAEQMGLGKRSEMFNVTIQAGAILAVVFIYRERLWKLCVGFSKPENRDYALKLLVAFLITAVLGLVVKKLGFELPETAFPIALALIVGGLFMLVAEGVASRQEPRTEISWLTAIVVGVSQIVAGIFPGTSRSGATIFAAMLTGTSDREAATDFAFILGIPTMFAASGYEMAKQLQADAPHENWGDLGIAFVVSTITAFIAVKWLLKYIQTHKFTSFAIYRLVVGAALLLLVRES